MKEENKEEKTASPEEETKETADEEVKSEEESNEETEDETESKNEEEPDWKQMAEDERIRREKAEKALAKKRYQSKNNKDDDAEEGDEESDEKYLTASELRAILAEDRKENQKEFLSSRVKETARELADSDDEANAIIAIFNNRTFPNSMTLEEQIKEAYFIAHGPRLLAKRDELRRSLRGKEGTKKDSADNVHRDAPKAGEPKISPQDKAELNRLGFKWDGKQYAKKLANGKNLIKDWNTKKVFVK